ncbi:MAG: hypothetical protein ACRDL7_01705, partial [Gaiellaceae bacterium]
MTTATPGHEEKLRADLASLRIDRSAGAQQAAKRRPARRKAPIVIGVVVLLIIGAAVWAVTGRSLPVTVAYAALSTPGQAGPAPVLSGSGYIVT